MERLMAELVVREKVWQELIQVARRHRKKPEDLAHAALVDFLQRQAAQKTAFPIGETEELIRQHRKAKETKG
jgi:predicted nucleic acid-binding protein